MRRSIEKLLVLAVFFGAGSADAGEIYTTYGYEGDRLARINTETGLGVDVGGYGLEFGAWSPWMVGSEFDTRGNLFGIYVEDFYDSETSQARLASIDRKTGAATLVGEPMELIVASAINTHDTMYALKALEPDYGVGDVATLYRINTETAQTKVAAADTGLVYTMDMSYDLQGRLWVVGGPRPMGNLLHTIDTATGVATLQSEISNVFDASGEPAEIMGIMFDETGKLYGTTFTENSILYEINPWTGAATPIGNGTGLDYPHGGDYISTPVAMLSDLVQSMDDMQIHHGIANALSTKLDHTFDLLHAGAPHADPIHQLENFVHFVGRHDGRMIAPSDADYLVSSALDIVALLDPAMTGSAAASAATIPEPAAFTLTLLGALCWATGLRRRMAV